MKFFDGLLNAVSGLGTARDKAAATEYNLVEPTWADLLTAYRTSWLAKKIVDVPADDSVREWRKWQGSSDQISLIEAEEKRLNLRNKVREARKMARLFGGALIYIGSDDSDLLEPFDPEEIGQGELPYLTVLGPQNVTTGPVITDPRDPWFGHPEFYSLTLATSGLLRIHPSRMARFDGSRRPDKTSVNGTSGGWHDSILMSTLEEVKRTDGVVASIASLTFEAKIDVIQIPNLMASIDDPQYEAKVLTRLAAAAKGKGNHGTLVMDAEEEYTQKSYGFSNLPELIERFQTTVSGAADIPTTRLFGRSPDGMNATGEGDIRNYYDMVRSQQTLEIEPALRLLDTALVRSALGEFPDDVHFVWSPLWQPSITETAEAGKTVAETIEILANTGLMDRDALASAIVTSMSEYASLPGLEAAVLGNHVVKATPISGTGDTNDPSPTE